MRRRRRQPRLALRSAARADAVGGGEVLTDRAAREKARIRERVWARLAESGAARFPFPPTGRIPNFDGARRAAERLLGHRTFERATRIKVNPDAPQRPVRELALRRGIAVLMPAPRLRAGFLLLDPERIPGERIREAATLSGAARLGRRIPLPELPRLDAVVVGAVAVDREGRRLGKGHGYGDLELGILRELGHPAVPVATTVHRLQWVPRLPDEPTDLHVALVATPEELLEISRRPRPFPRTRWERLPEHALREMPVLAELRRAAGARGTPRRPRPG